MLVCWEKKGERKEKQKHATTWRSMTLFQGFRVVSICRSTGRRENFTFRGRTTVESAHLESAVGGFDGDLITIGGAEQLPKLGSSNSEHGVIDNHRLGSSTDVLGRPSTFHSGFRGLVPHGESVDGMRDRIVLAKFVAPDAVLHVPDRASESVGPQHAVDGSHLAAQESQAEDDIIRTGIPDHFPLACRGF